MIAGVAHDANITALRRVERGLPEQIGHAEDGVHRRADLVAHVGQELALGAARFLGGLARALRVGDVVDDAAAPAASEPQPAPAQEALRAAGSVAGDQERERRPVAAAGRPGMARFLLHVVGHGGDPRVDRAGADEATKGVVVVAQLAVGPGEIDTGRQRVTQLAEPFGVRNHAPLHLVILALRAAGCQCKTDVSRRGVVPR